MRCDARADRDRDTCRGAQGVQERCGELGQPKGVTVQSLRGRHVSIRCVMFERKRLMTVGETGST